MVGMSIISQTSSNLIDPNENVVLDAAEIATREYGSKWVLVVEQMQISTIWLMKYCLLLMYNRLTFVLLVALCSKPILTLLQYEFESKLGCQVCRRLCHCRLRRYGDPVPGSLVSPIQPVLGCPSRQQYVHRIAPIESY